MLNLVNPVSYSREQQEYINTILKPLGKKAWDNTRKKTKDLKHHISQHTIIEQKGRCAYCEDILSKGSVQIEHLANKGKYESFTFESYNLVSSCTSCNSPANKGQKDTIIQPVDLIQYNKNKFLIVHPYLDNPDDHIKYHDNDRILIDYDNCTLKGKETIDMFNWQERWAINKRAIIAQTRNMEINVLNVVAEIAVYK